MSKTKKILVTIIAVILTGGYIAGMSYIVEQMRSPSIADPLSFGDYFVINANGEIDADDEKSTLYNTINALLRYSDDTELSELKLIDLYKIYFNESVTNPNATETIELEVADNIAEDDSLRLIHVDSDKSIEFVNITKDVKTRQNSNGEDEDYHIVVFDIDEEGHYGLVSKTGDAAFTFVISIVSVLGVNVLFLLLFVLIKARSNITQSKNTADVIG